MFYGLIHKHNRQDKFALVINKCLGQM